MKNIIKFSIVSSSLFPLLTLAAYDPNSTNPSSVQSILATIGGILNFVIPILVTLAVVYFIWGIITYMTAKDEEQKKLSRSKIINGLIALFVIIAFWGLIRIVMNTFDVRPGGGFGVVPCTPHYEGTQLVTTC